MLFTHILIALASLGLTTYAAFSPSQAKIKTSYVLIGLTLATGTYLTVLHPAHLTQVCTTGLIYLGVAMSGLAVARHRLAS